MERDGTRVGSTPKELFEVRSTNGTRVDPSSAIFPILRQPNPPFGDVRVVGTGFYIAHQGLFVTARHVLEECRDDAGQPTVSLTIVHRIPQRQAVIFRPIIRCFLRNDADIAVGMAGPMRDDKTGENLWSDCVVLSSKAVQPGDSIMTYAYPNATVRRSAVDWHEAHFYPLFYQGNVVECHPDGRDRVMMPGPCYQTSMHLHGGASGGPVFNSQTGRVCGVNSTGIAGATDVSFVSMIHGLLDIDISGVVLDGSRGEETVRLSTLVELGHVPFE